MSADRRTDRDDSPRVALRNRILVAMVAVAIGVLVFTGVATVGLARRTAVDDRAVAAPGPGARGRERRSSSSGPASTTQQDRQRTAAGDQPCAPRVRACSSAPR